MPRQVKATSQFIAINEFKTQSISWLFGASRNHRSRTPKRFPLMKLPAELRIMVAKFVFRAPKGLSWIWSCHRKGRRAATFEDDELYGFGRRLQDINALARTCRTLYEETRGLALKVNTLTFSPSNMHPSSKSPGWYFERTAESNWYLRAVEEALTFLEGFGHLQQTLQAQCVQLRLDHPLYFAQYPKKFMQIIHMLRDFQVEIQCSAWVVMVLSESTINELRELEEDGEPFVSQDDQMTQRISEYLKVGESVHDFVRETGAVMRNWRVFPKPLVRRDMAEIFGYMTVDEQEQVRKWDENGI
jgi:hypothetical protein